MAAAHSTNSVLVSTAWVDEHRQDPQVRLVEVDVDDSAYESGHVPGAVGWSWQSELCDPVRRDILSRTDFEQLASRSGISRDTTVVLYGENNNWFACFAFWQLKIYRHPEARLLNGGRKLWLAENRPLARELPVVSPTQYSAHEPDLSLRAFRDEVQASIRGGNINLIDVRSPAEYSGQMLAPPGMSETAQRGGHIPRALNVPWSLATNDDGTFKDHDALQQIYQSHGVTPYQDTITYCRIGERSAHSWFVLKYLLGYPSVKNYDGSWTEWGNLVNAPIVQGDRPV